MVNSISSVSQPVSNRTQNTYTDTSTPIQKTTEKSGSTDEDTVNISSQGKLAAKTDLDSLESYRIPNWMVDFVPNQNILNSADAMKETRAHLGMVEKMTADGPLSAAEKYFMIDQLANHSPATQKMHANAEFRMTFKNELGEYAGILRQAYDEAKQENGITSHEDYISKVLNAPDDNLALRDTLKENLLNNPRALELMDTLGIARPSLA